MSRLLCLVRFFFSVNDSGKLICKYFLCTVELSTFPFIHFVDLFDRDKREHADAFEHISVSYVSPILIKLKGRGFVRVEPNCVSCGLAHFFAL